MKYLLVLAVVFIGVWVLLGGRSRGGGEKPDRRTGGRTAPRMVACAHCGVHLPEHEAVSDAHARPFCSDAHRLAGPRAEH